MAKMMGPRFKHARRLGLNVYGHPKAMERSKPGTSRADKKLTEYGRQLLEKQRLRAYYGVMEGQFRRYFKKAIKADTQTGHALISMLETRLDNLVYRIGFASSSRQARQMVVHGHILINGKKVDRPSYPVKVGDKIELKNQSRKVALFKDNFESSFTNSYPYIDKDRDSYSAVLTRLPERLEIPIEIDDQLVVEFYSNLA